jgi:hypothetical protein
MYTTPDMLLVPVVSQVGQHMVQTYNNRTP